MPLLMLQLARFLLLVALGVGVVDPDVAKTVALVQDVDVDPVTQTRNDLDWLTNVTLIAVLSRIVTTAKPNMTN